MPSLPIPVGDAALSASALAGADDRAALDGIRSGDPGAFRTLFDQTFSSLHGFADTYLGDADRAREVVQDVFLELWTRRTTLVLHAGLRAYLFGAVRNRALNAVRRARTEARIFEYDSAVLAAVPGPGTTDTRLYAAELERATRRTVARMPERMRLVITLRWQHGLSNREIAEAAGISVKGVEKQMARALVVLRKALRGYAPA